MSHTHPIAESIDYGRELLHAGMDGIRAGERLMVSSDVQRQIANSARQSLGADVVGGSLAVVVCRLIDRRKVRLAPVFACGTAAFCADFLWRTRNISSNVIGCAEKEISKVRDQHWLESNPIDYA